VPSRSMAPAGRLSNPAAIGAGTQENMGSRSYRDRESGRGYALLADLRKEFSGTIHPYLPKLDKESRFAAQSAKIENGLISLPKEATWLAAFKNELMVFPNGRRDDQVDSVAQFLEWVSRRYACHRIESARTGVNPLRRDMVRR
jgi:phage terminase large subunit-like protein